MNGQDCIRAVVPTPQGPALLPFLTAGLPAPASSVDLFVAMAEAGADGFEVGVPYSDPLMDGPVIMRGSEAALAAGTSARVALSIVEQVASRTGKPVLAMAYANPVMQAGWEAFARDLAAAGACGLIVPDLPLEENESLRAACSVAGVGLVQFISPMSGPDRIRAVAAVDPAFIYGVSDLGVTGERATVSTHVVSMAERVRSLTQVPLVFGVGISTPEQAAAVAPLADGVIVGTALVRRVLEAGSAALAARSLHEAVADLVRALR